MEFENMFVDPNTLLMDLFVLEEDLFKQNRGLANHEPDNPFSEPAQIHTNVQNGYGVFTSYALTQTPIK